MAEFLTTTGVSHHLEEVIKRANDRLIIVSPYLKLNRRVRELLEERDRAKLDIRLVYGKRDLRPEEINWLESVSIRTSFRENLHAKCYMNEKQAILTSMNLYEFSQQNNDEMGVLVSIDKDPDLFGDIRREVQRILEGSDEFRVTVARVAPAETVAPPAPPAITRDTPRVPQRKPEPAIGIPNTAFCIRDKAVIPPNPGKPYCDRCFRSWNRYKNDEYGEKYCHICGNENDSTMAKPLCLSCYRTYKDILVTDDIADLPF